MERVDAQKTALPVVGMVGGGQLARMTAQAAVALGQTLRVLAASPADPAARVTPDVVLGDPDDAAALRELATGCSAVTFDHEGVPQEVLVPPAEAGVPLRPPPSALVHAQDKLVMRRRLSEMGLPVPVFAEVAAPGDVAAFGAEHGWPVVLKATRGGYDGRGSGSCAPAVTTPTGWSPTCSTPAPRCSSSRRSR